MAIKIIAAVGDNRLLGIKKDGVHGLPWHIPEDMKHFKHSTNECVVIMGRSTWESLPETVRPLPNRTNIVLTRNKEYIAGSAHTFTNLEEALAFAKTKSEGNDIWIIGGAALYREALPFVDELSLTKIPEELLPPPMEGEEHILFPEYEDMFTCTQKSPFTPSSNRNLPFRFETWKRKK